MLNTESVQQGSKKESTSIPETLHRVQMKRSWGWRKPPNTVYVGRPSRFGNPFSVENYGREQAIAHYREWIQLPENEPLLREAQESLRGKNLGCWCRLDQPCHADVLLDLINKMAPPDVGATTSNAQSEPMKPNNSKGIKTAKMEELSFTTIPAPNVSGKLSPLEILERDLAKAAAHEAGQKAVALTEDFFLSIKTFEQIRPG